MLPTILEADDTQAAETTGLEGVGFWLRALARGIDLTVHFAATFLTGVTAVVIVSVAAAVTGGDPDEALARMTATPVLGYVAALLGGLLMHVCSEGLHGSTIGKRLCGITVVREDGGPAGPVAALKRSLAFYVDSLFFGLLAAMRMADSPERQRIGDSWAGTVVVRIRALPPERRRSALRFVLAAAAGLTADAFVVFVEVSFRLL
jgi:uncharacterized RDD family membrane protein YckC